MTAGAAAADSALVRAAQAGDRSAFGELVGRYRPMTLALCAKLLGDPDAAEDAAQEAALQGLVHLNSLRTPGRFGAWLTGIGLNICRRWLRQRARAALSLEALFAAGRLREPVAPYATPEEEAIAGDLVERVRRAIATLPRGQQAAVQLYYLAGLTLSETSAQLGVAPNAVKQRLHQARAKLGRQLQELWQEFEEAMATWAAEIEEVDR